MFSTPSLYIESKRLLYLSVPKSGCTTTRSFLLKAAGLPPTPIHGRLELRPRSDDLEKVVKVFTFVRDPLERLKSCYQEKIRDPSFQSEHFKNGISKALARFDLAPGLDFESFVKFVAQTPDSQSDPHFRSQASILSDAQKVLGPGKTIEVFNLKSLDVTLKEIGQTFFGFSDLEVRKLNVSAQQKASGQVGKISKSSMELIMGRYEGDFALLDRMERGIEPANLE